MGWKMIKAYASYFVSYLMMNLKNFENVSKIILFGSVARGESNKKSDVDIFIEVKKKTKTFEKEIDKVVEEFYKSREGLMFKIKGIENKINVIVGKLEDWKDLSKSIGSTGIVFYGGFLEGNGKKGRKYSIFYWDGVEKNRGAFLNKVYGFRVSGKKYPGLIDKFEGKKLGKSSVMIPIEYRGELLNLFKHHSVNSK